MAGWTAPPTEVAGNAWTAAKWNTNVRDNLNWLHGAHGCRVWNSANQSIPDPGGGSEAAITFDSESFDTDSFHSTSSNTSRLVVPTGLDGYYIITGYVVYNANATGQRDARIKLNGATYLATGRQSSVGGGSNSRVLSTTTFRLVAADYVELMAFQTSGGALNSIGGDIDQNQLSLIYIGT